MKGPQVLWPDGQPFKPYINILYKTTRAGDCLELLVISVKGYTIEEIEVKYPDTGEVRI